MKQESDESDEADESHLEQLGGRTKYKQKVKDFEASNKALGHQKAYLKKVKF